MKVSRQVFVLIAGVLLGCNATPTVQDRASEVSSATWVLEEYPNSCADQCGVPNCGCIRNRCSASLEGQPCGPEGAQCNVVSGPFWYEMICEAPVQAPTTWTRISTSSCADECGAPNCNCITNRCAGNPEGQLCSPAGASCNVVSGPSVIELHCQ